MIQPRSCPAFPSSRLMRGRGMLRMLLALLLTIAPYAMAAATSNPPAAPQAVANTISLAEYRARLQSLDQLVLSCQSASSNCKSEQVGPDLKLALPSGQRQVRLVWLRKLLDAAATRDQKDQAEKDKAAKAQSPKAPQQPSAPSIVNPEFRPPTLAQQLEDARLRLAAESELAAKASAQAAGPVSGKPAGNSTSQRQTLAGILAAKEYHAAVAGPSLRRRLLEKIGNWLDRFFSKLQQAGFRSRWFGLAAEIGFGLLICLALAWFLIRLERQGRFGSASLRPETGSGAASARDWQLWLADAEKAAGHGAWRDAIHFLYWASISRLESGGMWPADRARTPREYLALVSAKSAQRTGLAALTRSFERTWYAGRPAAEADFQQAEQVAAQLGARLDSRSAAIVPPGTQETR